MTSRWRTRVISGSAIAATLGLLLSGSAAFAAGSGYAPTGGTGVTNVPGGFSSVITAVSVLANQLANIHVTVLNASVGIIVSPGAFHQTATVVVTAPNLPSVAPGGAPAGLLNFYPVAGLGLGFQINATQTIIPKGPITVTLQNPAIGPGDEVVEFTAQHRWIVESHVLRLQAGLITFYFTGDPDVAVVAPVAQYGYHVYGVHAAVQTNGAVQWSTEKPVGPVTYRNLGTDPQNTKDWLIAEMTHTAFHRHLSTPVPWVVYPQPKAHGKVGPVHPLPASAKA
jgi:hypothetical protein